ncbi:hypothetical protein QOZ80_1BG0096620 [Eleusine coracana subsp. coracana]|nr:hypothetical protein QOZ80_1BG0096620 [Eleusine coracana subsp. coracana]
MQARGGRDGGRLLLRRAGEGGRRVQWQAMGSTVTWADVEKIPGLNTLGVSMARVDYAPWGGVNPPHVHPRATEMIFVVEGALEVGFITTTTTANNNNNNNNNKQLFISKIISKGEVFVFPRGLVHFQRSVGEKAAVAVSAFNSQFPGTQAVAGALFGADPAVPTEVLARAFQVDAGVVDAIKAKFPPLNNY